MATAQKVTIKVSERTGSVSGLIIKPPKMTAMMVLAHGAGAGMSHRFMETLATMLGESGIGTFRFNFPYMEQGKKRPDVPAVAEKTVASALNKAHDLFPALPIIAAGKSFGGRMTSQFLSKENPSWVKAIVFYGFPLHAAGKPSSDRAAHLKNIQIPMLFLQGTRDALADIGLMEELCTQLPTSTLAKIEGADHSFKSGKKEFIPELVSLSVQFISTLKGK